MKKLTFVAAMLLGALTVNAGAYKHSVGLTVGSQYGFEYKTFVGEHFVVAADLGVQLGATKGMTERISFSNPDAQKAYEKVNESSTTVGYKLASWAFQGAANFAYQGTIADFSAGTLDWFAGGGLSLGMMQGQIYGKYKGSYPVNMKTGAEVKTVGDAWKAMADTRKIYKDSDDPKEDFGSKNPYMFKLGLNAYAGAEFALKSVPLVFGLDFRPGIGIGMKNNDDATVYDPETMTNYECNQLMSIAFFDWALNASVRYYF